MHFKCYKNMLISHCPLCLVINDYIAIICTGSLVINLNYQSRDLCQASTLLSLYRSCSVLSCRRPLCSRLQNDSHFYSLQLKHYFWAQLLYQQSYNIPNPFHLFLKVLEHIHLVLTKQMIILPLRNRMNIQILLFDFFWLIFFLNSLAMTPELNMHIHKRLSFKKNIMWIAYTFLPRISICYWALVN